MPVALGPNSNPNAFIPSEYIGSRPMRGALSYFMRDMYGPDMQADPNQMNQAAAGYYGARPTGDMGGEGQATAQRSFGDLIGGQAAAANSAAAQNVQRKATAGQGINAVAGATGNMIGSQIASTMALNVAKSHQGMQNLGLLSSLISAFSDPKGGGTNLINAFSGNTSGQSGLAQGVSGGKNMLSSLIWPPSGGASGGGTASSAGGFVNAGSAIESLTGAGAGADANNSTDQALGGVQTGLDVASAVPGPQQPFVMGGDMLFKLGRGLSSLFG